MCCGRLWRISEGLAGLKLDKGLKKNFLSAADWTGKKKKTLIMQTSSSSSTAVEEDLWCDFKKEMDMDIFYGAVHNTHQVPKLATNIVGTA